MTPPPFTLIVAVLGGICFMPDAYFMPAAFSPLPSLSPHGVRTRGILVCAPGYIQASTEIGCKKRRRAPRDLRKGVDGYQWTYSDRDPVSRANFILTRPQLNNLVNKSPTFFQPVTAKMFKQDVESVIGYVKCGKHWCLCRGKQLLPEDFNLNEKNAKIFYYEDLQLSDKVAVMCGIDESLVVENVKNVVFFNMQNIFTALNET
jgi:hypothetical protein